MDFRVWLGLHEDGQKQDSIFMNTDKTGLGPKPSTNAGLPKPSDGWLRGKKQPTSLFMAKKMRKA